MAVRKQYGYAGCTEHSPIRRKSFVGDPARGGFVHNPEVSTARGHRRKGGNPNMAMRQQQRHPCDPTRPVHKGPHHRPKGMGGRDWKQLMNSKTEFDY